jgi:metallo-beta-lactamase class B
MVYADSLSSVSADGFLFSNSKTYPTAVKDFEHSFAVLSSLPCDILLTPHPEMSDTLGRLERRERGDGSAFTDANACRTYVATFKGMFEERLRKESSSNGAN